MTHFKLRDLLSPQKKIITKAKPPKNLGETWMRCINKDTKEFIDLPINGGNLMSTNKLMFDYAPYTTWNELSSLNKPEYHYYALFQESDRTGFFGLWIDTPGHQMKLVTPQINLETNEIIIDDELKDILAGRDIYSLLNQNKMWI